MKIHHYSDEVCSIYNLASAEECGSWIERAEHAGFEIAPINSSSGFEIQQSVRNNHRVIFDDIELASLLWRRVKTHIPAEIDGWYASGLNERFRIYRYDPTHIFKRHSDGSFKRNDSEESRLTFMVYLNEGFIGGATAFNSFSVWPEQGMAVWFSHGLSHEGAVVTEGRKYVLRTDVMYSAKRN